MDDADLVSVRMTRKTVMTLIAHGKLILGPQLEVMFSPDAEAELVKQKESAIDRELFEVLDILIFVRPTLLGQAEIPIKERFMVTHTDIRVGHQSFKRTITLTRQHPD